MNEYYMSRREVERRIREEMAKDIEPMGLESRIAVAVVITLIVAFLVFLGLDIANGWGMGWVVLGWIALAAGASVLLGILIAAWAWVFNATGRAQVKNRGK